jgi:hypothetical protein
MALGPTHPPIQDTNDAFPQAYREDDNSPVSSDKVDNERSYTSASPYAIELNITEIFARCKIRLVESMHNTAQASLSPKI